jgi:hypothetical protein
MASERTALRALVAATALVGACDDPGTEPELPPKVPLAYVRFVNAVPDTIPTDWRFIDQVEYSPAFFRMAFRSATPYQGAQAGNRHLRIFPDTNDINVTKQFFIDTVLALAADTYYTIVHLGNTRPGVLPADQILLLVDSFPAVAGDSFAVRTVHLGIGLGNQDVYASPTTGALPATPLFSNVAYGTRSAYVTQPLGPMVLRAANNGTVTVNATATADTGIVAKPDSNLTAIAGSKIKGSVLSAFYFPRSVAGSRAPQTAAFLAPALVYLKDRHPR